MLESYQKKMDELNITTSDTMGPAFYTSEEPSKYSVTPELYDSVADLNWDMVPVDRNLDPNKVQNISFSPTVRR